MVSSDDIKRCAISDKGPVTMKLEGNPTFLVVDDEELMREVATIMIEENGGKVLTAVDGIDAVEVFAENQGKLAGIFMDISMPRMNGYEALLEIRKLNPSIPVLVVSGLEMTPEIKAMAKEGRIDFLSKPFHEVELIKALKKLPLQNKK